MELLRPENLKNMASTSPFTGIEVKLKEHKKEYDLLVKTLKKELVSSIREFFKDNAKYVSEIFWVHRSSQYNDEGSSINSGELFFKTTEVANYLIDQTPDLRNKLLDQCDHHEETEDFVTLSYNIEPLNKITSPVKQCLLDLFKLQELLYNCSDDLLGDMFGNNMEVHILNNGKVELKEFSPYGD